MLPITLVFVALVVTLVMSQSPRISALNPSSSACTCSCPCQNQILSACLESLTLAGMSTSIGGSTPVVASAVRQSIPTSMPSLSVSSPASPQLVTSPTSIRTSTSSTAVPPASLPQSGTLIASVGTNASPSIAPSVSPQSSTLSPSIRPSPPSPLVSSPQSDTLSASRPTSTSSQSVPPLVSTPRSSTPSTPSSSPSSTSSEPVPSASSIAMTILTRDPSSESGIDYFYAIPVKVGSLILNLQLHTLASNTIVYTVQPDVAAAKISLYSPSPAQTPESIPWICQAQNLQVDGSVVNGSLVYRDRLTIHDGPVSVDQALAIANAVPFGSYGLPEGVAPNRSWDGVLSLTRQNAGLLHTNDGKQNTLVPQASWFDSILPQLRAPVIGIALKHQAPGFIDLGQLNDKMYTGDIQWASSNSLVTGYWSFHVTAYRIGTDPAVTCDFDMQINTGTKYTTFDTDAVNTFRQEVASLMGMETIGDTPYYKCGVDLPNITLTMVQAGGGSFDLTIPGKAFELPNGTTCEFGLKTMGADSGRFALGIPALQTLYVVLNASAPSIGFAPQVDHPDSF